MKKIFSYLPFLVLSIFLIIPQNTSALSDTDYSTSWVVERDAPISVTADTFNFNTCDVDLVTAVTKCEYVADTADVYSTIIDNNVSAKLSNLIIYHSKTDPNVTLTFLESIAGNDTSISSSNLLKALQGVRTDGREYDIATNSNSYVDNDRYTITHGAFVDYTAEFTGNENISKFELGVGIVFNNRYVHLQNGRIFSYRNSNIPLLFTYGNEICDDDYSEVKTIYNRTTRQEWIDNVAKECGTDTNIYGTEFNFEIFNTYGADLGVRINDVYSTVAFNDIAFRESQYVNNTNQALTQAEVFIYIKSISYVTENAPTLDVARVSPSVDTTNLDYLSTFARFTEFQNQTKTERFAAIEQLEEANQWVVNRTANDGTTTSYYFSWDFENCLELYPEGELNNVSQLAIDTNIASGQVKCWAAVDDSFLDRLKYQQYISFFVPLEVDEENTGFTSLAAQYYYYLLFPITAVADIFNRTAFENYNEEICVFKKNYKIDNNTDEVYSHLSAQELEVFNGLGDLVGLLCIDVAEIREEYRKEHFYHFRRFIEQLDILFLSPLLIILLIIQIIKRKRT